MVFACCLLNSLVAQIQPDGLSLWLKADAGVKWQGGTILVWNDQGPNHLDAVPLLNQTYKSPQLIPKALNNLPVIRFNGLNNGMATKAFYTFPQKRGTIFLVAKTNGNSKTSGVGFGNFISTYHGGGVQWQFGATLSKYSYYDGVGGEGFLISGSPPSEWGITTISRVNDTTMEYYRNGRYEFSFRVNDNLPDINSLKIGFNGRLGNNGDSIPEVLNGDIAEVIIYDKNLSPEGLSAIHQYLSNKYGIELAPPPVWARWWFIGTAILLLITIIFAWAQFLDRLKLKKRLAEMERQREMDNERHRISREMHDDIGAGLTQIVLMSEALKNKPATDNVKELDDIADTSRRLVGSISEIIWSLNPENKTLGHLFAYMREQLNKQLEYPGMQYNIDFNEGAQHILLSNQQRRNILMITKEIVNNAIKHSTAKNIWVQALIKNNNLELVVKDDGKGFDVAKGYAGNGLKNVHHRAGEIGGKLSIGSGEGKLSRFTCTIPLLLTT